MTDQISSTGSPLYRGISPLTGKVLSEFPHATDKEVKDALDAADVAGPGGDSRCRRAGEDRRSGG
ncbi:hypothetical protein [Corynebacterium glyciniphilum]|uniref:hypothetical protein n=1 Tax=Corynebacterium glyciniphilum TaxID=1404244 RepID=UPI003FD62A60